MGRRTFFNQAAATVDRNVLIICDRGGMDPSAYIDRESWLRMLKEIGVEEFDLLNNRYDQLDYILTRKFLSKNFPQKSRTVCDVAFCSDQRPVQEFRERNRGVPLQLKIDMAGLKDEEYLCWSADKEDAQRCTKCTQYAVKETLRV
ncbi:hypothetical protein RB195_024667 [Necator americanus]|uniref:NadR/Ttd14 AAA domain-containing protein n=1 Tax=Necator americanus TaxID=51031 RepID=A0ABR1EPF1_NECAM